MEHVSVSEPDDDGVFVLTVDRPPANAMDLALLRGVVEVSRSSPPKPRARSCSPGDRAASRPGPI